MSSSDDGRSKTGSGKLPESAAAPADISDPVRDVLIDSGIDLSIPEVRQTVVTILTKLYAGPIPPAEMLAEYERVRPGLASEIIGWTQQQQQHRRGLELLTTRGSESRLNRGQAFSLCLALASIIAAGLVGVYGSAWASAVIAIVGVGGPSTATVLARILGRSDRASKQNGE